MEEPLLWFRGVDRFQVEPLVSAALDSLHVHLRVCWGTGRDPTRSSFDCVAWVLLQVGSNVAYYSTSNSKSELREKN
jgi:hypothetical protein